MVEDESRVDEFLQKLEELDGMYVEVGILSSAGGEMLTIASVQEFGANITVTDKMRGYMAANFGVHLKQSTTSIKIPERSFIRSSFDAKQEQIYEQEELLAMVLEGQMTARGFYEALGQTCVDIIKDYLINEVNSPANSSLTTSIKGSSNPLVDTGKLVNSITYQIKKG